MKKKLSLLLATVMMVGSLTACGGVQTDSDKAKEEKTEVEVTEGKDAYSEDIKLAFLPVFIGDAAASAWSEGMQEYLKSFPNIKFDMYDGEGSVDAQVKIMDELINQKYDAILLQAVEATGLVASVDKAEAAGIPVITVNLDADTVHTGLVAGVDVEAGEIIANEIGTSFDGAAKVVIISATAGASKGEKLDKGFKDTMKEKYPDVEILDEQSGEWLTENANIVMSDFLTKYKELDAVFCHNDPMAEGAAEACKAVGRDDIQIWGVDGESKMLDYIDQGLCEGTVYTNFYAQGQLCAQQAVYAIQSGITGANLSKTPLIKMAPIVVKQDNLNTITEDMRW